MTSLDNGYHAKGSDLVALGAAFVALAGLVVGGRLYSHVAVTKHLVIEDIFIFIAWVFAVLVVVSFSQQNKWGLGYHASELTQLEVTNFLKWFYVTLWTYNCALTCTKFSILLQYRRLFTLQATKLVINIALVALTIYGLGTFLDCVFICWPIKAFWTLPPGNDKCLKSWPVFIGNTVVNIITDLVILFGPFPILAQLHLPRRQKIALMALFLVGGIVIVVSTVRLVVFIESNGATDFSYENVTLGRYSIIEVAVAIICASVPALKPLIVKIFPAFGSTNSGTRSQTYGTAISASRNRRDAEKGNVTHISRLDRADDEIEMLEREEFRGKDGINVVTTTTVEARGGSS